jgi:DNA-binding MarR family transcriptional regulator
VAGRRFGATGRRAPLTVSRTELLVGGSDEVFRDFIHDFLAFSERVMAVREGFGSLIGLTGIEYTVLVSIAHLQARGPVSINMVARHLHFSGAFITTVTNGLVRAGMVAKRRDDQDRRRLAVSTTARADRALAQLAPVQREVNDLLFRDLGRAQFRALQKSMESFVEAGDQALRLLDYYRARQPHCKAGDISI